MKYSNVIIIIRILELLTKKKFVMKRILIAATIVMSVALGSCGNQSQSPDTNSTNNPSPADTSTSSPNAGTNADTGMMHNDTAAGHSMQDSAMPK